MGFLVWMFPTQHIAQKLQIAKYLSVNIVLWGVLVMLHAVCKLPSWANPSPLSPSEDETV